MENAPGEDSVDARFISCDYAVSSEHMKNMQNFPINIQEYKHVNYTGMASRALKNRSLYLKLYERCETRQIKFSYYTSDPKQTPGPMFANQHNFMFHRFTFIE